MYFSPTPSHSGPGCLVANLVYEAFVRRRGDIGFCSDKWGVRGSDGSEYAIGRRVVKRMFVACIFPPPLCSLVTGEKWKQHLFAWLFPLPLR